MVAKYRGETKVSKIDVVNALSRANIPEEEYSINGYCESCLCIEPVDNGWRIYHGERGIEHNAIIVPNIDKLVSEVCDRLGYEKPTLYSTSTQQVYTIQKLYNRNPFYRRGRMYAKKKSNKYLALKCMWKPREHEHGK